jgi:hypothetical protein
MIPEPVKKQFIELSSRYRDLCVYALVDGVQYQQHIGNWIVPHQEAAIALFAKTQDEALAHAGPWLIVPEHTCHCAVDWLALEQTRHGVIWLISWLDINTQVAKLRTKLNGQQPDGKNVLVRFWDPRVINALYHTLTPQIRKIFFSDALEWHFIKDGKRLYINVIDHA